ncbi:phosphopentomutase [Alkalibaculum sp. M08DMB]|uniref:Phosphopentomutase n=1 Tax=Alkalibaculum sporogenes TaxID=2655001 RepID=A0A6A7K701_9FIRM|nr:phosphopentomutase [Alkalibaculum sporogenes]MPW25194.1 phosphopentomutase [Alkalibaculum sporogenes]
MSKRVIWIVIDSVGIGELPDAHLYGDEGSNTLENIYRSVERFKLPNLECLGLGCIDGVSVIPKPKTPIGAYGKAMEKSPGKDTTTGHWEMAGIILDKPFPTFPDGFPKGFIKKFEDKINKEVIGNYAASGTEIIQELGDEHVRTGKPIVYTSADSVFQIAAHEDIIPLDELYNICKIARELLVDDLSVGRVIARPFIGKSSGSYTRTSHRHDFSLVPTGKTVLDAVKDAGLSVMGVGKINDIFVGRGITDTVTMENNQEGIDCILKFMSSDKKGLIFANLVDFDMHYGHRNDVAGYAKALVEFDNRLPEIMEEMSDEDILVINADHGCDPTTNSTDHSREYIPILVYGKKVQNVNLGIRKTFADIGATICDVLQVKGIKNGESFIDDILK